MTDGSLGMTTRAAAAQLRSQTVGVPQTQAAIASHSNLALAAPDLLAAAANRSRPTTAKRTSTNSHDSSFQGAEGPLKGATSLGKKRAALGDISNTTTTTSTQQLQGSSKASAPLTQAHVLGTRELDAIMSRPLSNMEARLQLEQRRCSGSGPARIGRGATTDGRGATAELEESAIGHPVEPAQRRAVWKDIDAPHKKDPLMVATYIVDIYAYLRRIETKHRPRMGYMDEQLDINHTMRGILVDWLVEVAEEYKLVADTLFLAVNLIDRYLSREPCARCLLQLVGVTCMLVAAKFEEIYAPQVEDFCYITDNTYQHAQVVEMERKVLDKLGFNLATPTIKTFVRRYLRAAECNPNDKVDCLASFLAELTLLGYNFLQYPPSLVAAACTFLALYTLNKPAWTVTLEHYTRYKAHELKDCTLALHEVFVGASKSALPAIREKYNNPKLKAVSTIVPHDTLPDYLFDVSFDSEGTGV